MVETRLAELAELVSRPADTHAADAIALELAELRAAVERPAFDARPLEERLRIEAEATISMFMRRDMHTIGAAAFKAGRKPEWPHHGL